MNEQLLLDRIASLGLAAPKPELIDDLEQLVRNGDDYDLFRINPIRYGRDRDVPEQDAVDLFLYASHFGIFEMEWLIVCAACSNVSNSFSRLAGLDPHFTCSLCSMENEADMDEYIQIGFTISPDIREIIYHDPFLLTAEQLYFDYHLSDDTLPVSTGESTKETLRSWARFVSYIEPGETVETTVEIESGGIFIIDPVNSTSAFFLVPAGEMKPSEVKLEMANGSFEAIDRQLIPLRNEIPRGESFLGMAETGTPPAEGPTEGPASYFFSLPAAGMLSPGTKAITVHNSDKQRAAVVVLQYPMAPQRIAPVQFDSVLSGKRLLSTQTFRALFRSETLPETESIQIRDLTYLFTDLTGSTAMYDETGDASAYNLVRLHFDALGTVVASNHGAIVKTIGDAVMATFVDPADAVRAALACREALGRFNQTNSSSLNLKIGVHRGHSVAVTLNGQVDYFGQSVNIAARVQALAESGEIVVTDEVHEAPGVGELLSDYTTSRTVHFVKGVSQEIRITKIEQESPVLEA